MKDGALASILLAGHNNQWIIKPGFVYQFSKLIHGYTCISIVSVFQANTRLYIDCISFTDFLGCMRSAFSLKISLALISSGAIANHDVIITIRDWDQTRLIFLRPRFSRLAALPLASWGLAFSNFAKKKKRLLAVYWFFIWWSIAMTLYCSGVITVMKTV